MNLIQIHPGGRGVYVTDWIHVRWIHSPGELELIKRNITRKEIVQLIREDFDQLIPSVSCLSLGKRRLWSRQSASCVQTWREDSSSGRHAVQRRDAV